MLRLFTVISILVILISACNSDDIISSPPPFVKFTDAPSENEILHYNNVTIKWDGLYDSTLYRYRLMYWNEENLKEDYYNWSSYTEDKDVLLKNLDDAEYYFELESIQGENTDNISLNFSVKTVSLPALRFFKINNSFNAGSDTAIYLFGEGMEEADRIVFPIVYDKNFLDISGAEMVSEKYSSIAYNIILKDTTLYEDIIPGYSDMKILQITTGAAAPGLKDEKFIKLYLSINSNTGRTTLQTTSPYYLNGDVRNNLNVPPRAVIDIK